MLNIQPFYQTPPQDEQTERVSASAVVRDQVNLADDASPFTTLSCTNRKAVGGCPLPDQEDTTPSFNRSQAARVSEQGDKRKKRKKRNEGDRFWAHVGFDPNGCWLWQGSRDSAGYGQFRTEGRKTLAHRWVVNTCKGGYPPGHETDHLCNTRACVRPDHLDTVTHKENCERREQRRREKVEADTDKDKQEEQQGIVCMGRRSQSL